MSASIPGGLRRKLQRRATEAAASRGIADDRRGTLGILSVGAGDTKLSFDPSRPAEVARAAAAVRDMLARGYAILVQVGERDGRPLYQRAIDFDPQTAEYIIVGTPEPDAAATPSTAAAPVAPATVIAPAPQPKKRRGRPPKMRLPAATTAAVAVARSAGG